MAYPFRNSNGGGFGSEEKQAVMENVLLVVHVITCIALIGVVLLQRSEGGALGIGGGGGGGLMSGRGAASALTRTTMILAAVFFATSLTLTSIATRNNPNNASLGEIASESDANTFDLPSDVILGPERPSATPTPVPDLPADIEAPVSVPQPDGDGLPADQPQN